MIVDIVDRNDRSAGGNSREEETERMPSRAIYIRLIRVIVIPAIGIVVMSIPGMRRPGIRRPVLTPTGWTMSYRRTIVGRTGSRRTAITRRTAIAGRSAAYISGRTAIAITRRPATAVAGRTPIAIARRAAADVTGRTAMIRGPYISRRAGNRALLSWTLRLNCRSLLYGSLRRRGHRTLRGRRCWPLSRPARPLLCQSG